MASPSMRLTKTIRTIVTLVALLALLLFTSALGEVFHHHQDPSADNHCQICHLSHQGIESAAQGHRLARPERVALLPTQQDTLFAFSFRAPLRATRAPPSA